MNLEVVEKLRKADSLKKELEKSNVDQRIEVVRSETEIGGKKESDLRRSLMSRPCNDGVSPVKVEIEEIEVMCK